MSGMGFPCCRDLEFVFRRMGAPPFQFYGIGDRIFLTGWTGGFSEPINPAIMYRHVAQLDADRVVRVYRFEDGAFQADPIYTLTPDNITPIQWSDFVDCMFGSTENPRNRNSFSSDFGLNFEERGRTDLRQRRAFDIGDHLYDVAEEHGDITLGEGTIGIGVRSGVDSGKIYAFADHVPAPTGSTIRSSIALPYFSNSRTPSSLITIQMQTVASSDHPPCLQSQTHLPQFQDPTKRVDGVMGFGAGPIQVRMQPHYRGGPDQEFVWRVNNSTDLVPIGTTDRTPAIAGQLIEVRLDCTATGITPRYFIDGVEHHLLFGVSTTSMPDSERDYPDNERCLNISINAIATGENGYNPDEWTIGFADYIRVTKTGTGRDAGRWAGFDVEYDNVQSVADININGRWTFRSGRNARIRPTSWGMQWPINYTAIDLPFGFGISSEGVFGSASPLLVGNNGTATVTATDATGRTVTTSHPWEIVA